MKLKKILLLAILSCSATKAECNTASCAIEGTPHQGLDFWLETFDKIAQEILKLVEQKGIELSELTHDDLKEIMTKVKIPKHIQDFIVKGLEEDFFQDFFAGWFSSKKNCESEGRKSAKEICPKNDSPCKERVHNNTRDKCQEHEQKMNSSSSSSTTVTGPGGTSITHTTKDESSPMGPPAP
jgi:hypothetical protein